MTKYTRHQSVISRQSDSEYTDDAWTHRYNTSLEKGGVQPKKDSLFDELNTIMNGAKSKYTSVEAAVEDMKQRSGLTDYLNKQSKEQINSDKVVVAQKQDNTIPLIIQKNPQVLQTLENIIKDTKGNSSIPAIISRLEGIHAQDVKDKGEWDDERLIRLISKLNLQAKVDNPQRTQNLQNLGLRDKDFGTDVDPSNVDAFHSLLPNKG